MQTMPLAIAVHFGVLNIFNEIEMKNTQNEKKNNNNNIKNSVYSFHT